MLYYNLYTCFEGEFLAHQYSVDILIIGGGIAGLWILNRLCKRGYNAILIENSALGSFQTCASQGMIHGGIKYSLGGAFTGASEAIADMPNHWRACLRGDGDVDLREAAILSDHFYLWSTASITSLLGGFLASKMTRGRVEKVARQELPPIFAHPHFHGSLYRLVDMVVDTPSVIKALAANYRNRIFAVDRHQWRWLPEADGRQRLHISADNPQDDLVIDAQAFVLAAGRGNGDLLAAAGAASPQMQLRPLQQVMVKHSYPHRFFGHCVGADKTPRLSISSHPLGDGSQVWYLGGNLAEKGANQSAHQVIGHAKQELAALMPWVDLSDARWATIHIERAEPRQLNLMRPDNAFAAWASPTTNIIAAWPTKLTLAPDLARQVENLLDGKGIAPSGGACPPLPLQPPKISATPWAEAFSDDKQ